MTPRQESIQRIATAPDRVARQAAIEDYKAQHGAWWEKSERVTIVDQDGTELMSAGGLERLPHKQILSDAMRAWLGYAFAAGFLTAWIVAAALVKWALP